MIMLPYGILFQEYYVRVQSLDTTGRVPKAKLLRVLWILASLIITMAYSGNLKVLYEDPLQCERLL